MSGTKEALNGSAINRWSATEGQSISDFQDQLPTLTALLRSKRITQKDFYLRLIGNGQPFRAFLVARAEDASALEPFCFERTAEGELRISSRQVGDIPQVTAQIGLTDEGQLTIEQVFARLIDHETAVSHEVEGEFIGTTPKGISMTKEQFGKNMLNALLNNFTST